MNDFVKETLNISDIIFCIRVDFSNTKLTHNCRSTHGLVYIESGEAVYNFKDENKLFVKQGDIIYLPKFSSYRVQPIKFGTCIVVNFDLFSQNKTYAPFVLRNNVYSTYHSSFKDILFTFQKGNLGYKTLLLSQVYNLIHSLIIDLSQQYTSLKTRGIAETAVKKITCDLTNSNLTVNSVAEFCNVSTEYLRKIFISIVGVSPKQFIIETRLKKAKELILLRKFSVRQIAEMCGYEDESYFCKEFKRKVKSTPLEYLRNNYTI